REKDRAPWCRCRLQFADFVTRAPSKQQAKATSRVCVELVGFSFHLQGTTFTAHGVASSSRYTLSAIRNSATVPTQPQKLVPNMVQPSRLLTEVAEKVRDMIGQLVKISIVDSRVFIGRFIGFDKQSNVILSECREYRRV